MREPELEVEPEHVFAGNELAIATIAHVRTLLEGFGDVEQRVSATQVAFRRRRGFVYVWDPGRWIRTPPADVILSIGLEREDDSPRWREIVHPTANVWMHHLVVDSLDTIDDEVVGWLREAFDAAA